MNLLDLLCLRGRGIPHDHAQARHWFQKAAVAGSSAAMHNFGGDVRARPWRRPRLRPGERPRSATRPPPTTINLTQGATKEPAIYARELLQILSAGYRIGFAKRSERPEGMKDREDVLILRPPEYEKGKRKEILSAKQTRLNPGLWDRDVKQASKLVASINGKAYTGADLGRLS